jgi:MFS family permease
LEKTNEETPPGDEAVVIHADDDGKTLAEREVEYEKFVWTHLKRNYIAHYLHGMLGMTGFRLVNAPTFLPAYLYLISGSSFIVGLGLALQQVGGMLSPIFGATQIEHRKRVMPAAVWMGGLARIQILGMALAGWFLSGQTLVVAILSFMFMFGLFMGTQGVVFSLLMAKVIPISRRGRLQAWRNATGGVIAAALAWVAGRYFIEGNMLGNGYATTFLFATILTTAGLWALQALMIEPEPPTTRAQTPFFERLKDFPRLVSQDRGYMFFLIVQMLAITGRMATPFYILYVSTTIELTGANIGLLTLAFLGADTLANLVWGYLGDRTGFRLVLISSLVIWITSTVLLMNVHEVWAIFLAFCGLGASQSGYMMSAQTMILEFGNRDDMPMRIALSSTASGVMASAGPLAGGLMAATLGYQSVFGASIAFLTAGLLLLLFMVREPRKDRLASL